MDNSLVEAIKKYRDEQKKRQDVETYIEISKSVRDSAEKVREHSKQVEEELENLRSDLMDPDNDLLEELEVLGNKIISSEERGDPDYSKRIMGVDGSFRGDIKVLQRTLQVMVACRLMMRGEPYEDPPTDWATPDVTFVPEEIEKKNRQTEYIMLKSFLNESKLARKGLDDFPDFVLLDGPIIDPPNPPYEFRKWKEAEGTGDSNEADWWREREFTDVFERTYGINGWRTRLLKKAKEREIPVLGINKSPTQDIFVKNIADDNPISNDPTIFSLIFSEIIEENPTHYAYSFPIPREEKNGSTNYYWNQYLGGDNEIYHFYIKAFIDSPIFEVQVPKWVVEEKFSESINVISSTAMEGSGLPISIEIADRKVRVRDPIAEDIRGEIESVAEEELGSSVLTYLYRREWMGGL